MHFFHRIFKPHCPDCQHEKECRTCDVLRELLEKERAEKLRLIELLTPARPNSIDSELKDIEPIRAKHIPWPARQQMLEAEDREKARRLAEQRARDTESLAELEKKAGLNASQEQKAV